MSGTTDGTNDQAPKPIQKNIWSVQKTLGFRAKESFQIELEPGYFCFIYLFFFFIIF